MSMKIRIFSLLALLFFPNFLFASSIPARELSKLFDDSNFVVIGEVSEVTLIEDNGRNGQEYEIKIEVVTPIKGEVRTQSVTISTYIGGVKGFGMLLKPNQKGVFFFHSIEGEKGALTHHGAIALFEGNYFE